MGIAVGDRLRACGSHRNQVAYPHEGMSRLRKRSERGHMSWGRGKRYSSKGGLAWKLYKHKIAVFFGGFEPSISGPQAATKGLILSGIPYAASTPCWVTRNWSIWLRPKDHPCSLLLALTPCCLPGTAQDLISPSMLRDVFAVESLSSRGPLLHTHDAALAL